MPKISTVVSTTGNSHTPLATGVFSAEFLLAPDTSNLLVSDAIGGGITIPASLLGATKVGSNTIPLISNTADIGSISAVANNSTIQQLNSIWTIAGTANGIPPATTNAVLQLRRVKYQAAATANSTAGFVQTSGASLMRTVGKNAHFSCIFTVSSATNIATECGFFGFQNGATATTAFTPLTKTNCFGIGYDPASPNLRMYVAGTTVSAPIDLGANFPRGFNESNAYKVSLYLSSQGEITATGNIGMWHVYKVGSPTVTASGVIPNTGTNGPANTLFLSPTVLVTPMATAAASAISFTNATFANGLV